MISKYNFIPRTQYTAQLFATVASFGQRAHRQDSHSQAITHARVVTYVSPVEAFVAGTRILNGKNDLQPSDLLTFKAESRAPFYYKKKLPEEGPDILLILIRWLSLA